LRKSVKVGIGAAALTAAASAGILVDSGFRAALNQAVERAVQVRLLQRSEQPQDKVYDVRYNGAVDLGNRIGGGGSANNVGNRIGGGGAVQK
jgi:hypothetical protein